MASTAPDLETLRAVVRRHLPAGGYRAFLFGSRAAGTAAPNADWDIGIDGPHELPRHVLQRIARGLEVASPRRARQSAFRLGWIDDDRLWLDMLEDRNRASHSYRETTADRIRDRLPEYAAALRALLAVLRQQS